LIPMQLVYFLMISPLQHKYDYPPVDWSLQYKLWYLSMHWLLHHKIRVSPNETRIKKYDVDFDDNNNHVKFSRTAEIFDLMTVVSYHSMNV
jgi:hypothetical protein